MSAEPHTVGFDWRNPDYTAVIVARVERLRRLRADPSAVPALKAYYRDHVARFIDDWGVTADPRNALLSPPRAVVVPFMLFPKQIEWVDWVLERARQREPGITEKSRDCGVSWLAMATAVSLCLFNCNLTIGFGSAKEDKIDRSGDPDCLFWKARTFLRHLPPEFRGSWDEGRHSAHLRITFPETGSAIVGEAGDNIGRGGRQSITFLDEAAHIERSELIDASLASTTDCRIDMSSVNGMTNSFAQRRHSGKIPVFRFHWRDDPRKDEAWYAKQCEILDPVTLAAEVDIDYRASSEGVLIPAAWVQSAVGAHLKLGIEPSGAKGGALDVADEGIDRNAFAGRHGVVVECVRSWSGKNRDIFDTVCQAFGLCEEMGYRTLDYDADGLGAGVRGDARIVNDQRRDAGKEPIRDEPYRGSGAVYEPESEMVQGRKNKDFFANLKAQSWWSLRMRFQATHRTVIEGREYDPDSIISLAPGLPELAQLVTELAQPTYSINGAGKILIDKAPAGTRSPNLADAVCIVFNPASLARSSKCGRSSRADASLHIGIRHTSLKWNIVVKVFNLPSILLPNLPQQLVKCLFHSKGLSSCGIIQVGHSSKSAGKIGVIKVNVSHLLYQFAFFVSNRHDNVLTFRSFISSRTCRNLHTVVRKRYLKHPVIDG